MLHGVPGVPAVHGMLGVPGVHGAPALPDVHDVNVVVNEPVSSVGCGYQRCVSTYCRCAWRACRS